MSAYEKVIAARDKKRPTALDYINNVFSDFIQLHGDRCYSDDRAVVCGIARLGEDPVTVIGLERGHDTREKVARNFGSAHPEGYRKALRHMKLAEKFNRPVICIIDTSGAYCGIGAEERGQGHAIATNLVEMMDLGVPVISLLIGEGGSGGALALGVANEVWMLENSIYSVISPEGCASILWKDSTKVEQASECLRLTAADLLGFEVIERIIEEPEDITQIYDNLRGDLIVKIKEYSQMNGNELRIHRYDKFRKIGFRE